MFHRYDRYVHFAWTRSLTFIPSSLSCPPSLSPPVVKRSLIEKHSFHRYVPFAWTRSVPLATVDEAGAESVLRRAGAKVRVVSVQWGGKGCLLNSMLN